MRQRRTAWIVAGLVAVLFVGCVAARLRLPDPARLCDRILEDRQLLFRVPGKTPSEQHAECVRRVTLQQLSQHGPRARLVQNNVARCLERLDDVEARRRCVRKAQEDDLLQALVRFP